jgi:hypothetical protein
LEKTVPRLARKEFDAAAEKVGQDKPRILKSTGPARKALEPATVEVVDRPIDKEWADAMAFNEEQIKIVVHETTDATVVSIPDFYVNGIPQRFIRGQEIVVKRKFVQLLARCRKTTFSQEKVRNGNGDEEYRNVPHTALAYPFSVLEDPNPRGRDWLKNIQAEA